MSNKLFLISILLLALYTTVFSNEPYRVGTTAANFLEIGFGSSGAAMGDDPKRHVVHPDGYLHSVPSVYIADASLFPTSTKVNPYETVMLLATHVANKVVNN